MTRTTYRPLTARQEAVLRFICAYIGKIGYPPSIREIGDEFGISSLRGAVGHLERLERKGYISRASTPRSIKILHPAYRPGSAATMVPLIKEHHTELLAEWNVERLFPVSSKMLDRAVGAFIVRVRGDAMAPAIMPRDLAVCVPQETAQHGDLMAFAIEGEVFVRKIEYIDGSQFLVTARPDYPEIAVDDNEDIRMLGRVVGLMRDYEGEAF